MTTLSAALRPLRAELVAVAGLTALLVLAAGGVALRLVAFDIPIACFDLESIAPDCVARQHDVYEYQALAGNLGGTIAIVATYLPALAGVILGMAAVAKELDQRTAVLAWSVDASRRHWLLQRVLPLVGCIVALGVASPQLIDAMFRLSHPGSDGGVPLAFEAIPYAGLGPMAMGVSAFGVTIVIGAMLGRLLPGLLAAAAFVVFASLLVQQVNEQFMAGDSLVVEAQFAQSGRQIDYLLRTPEGQLLSWDEGFTQYGDPFTGELPAGFTEMTRYVPIEIYHEVAARFALLHLLVGFVSLTLAFVVVERRSP